MSVTAQPRLALPDVATAVGIAQQPAVWLALLTFALYLPPAASVLQIDPDSIEHLDLARHVAAGQGYLLGIKSFHFGGGEVVHNGLDERAPLFPFLVAALLRLGLPLISAQLINVLFASGCVAVVAAIGACLFGRRVGALAGLLAAASPIVFVHLVPPMTEACATFLTLLAVWLVVRDLETPTAPGLALAGAALGLGYLARPTELPLAALLIAGLLMASRRRGRLFRPLLALCIGLSLFVMPMTLYSLATRGTPSYSSQTYLYAVFSDHDVLDPASLRPLPSPADFILANRDFVVGAMLRNVRAYARELFLDPKWLLLLLPAWPFAIVALARGRYPRPAWAVLCLAAGAFFLYALTWSTYRSRYQVLAYLLLLPFAVDGVGRLGLSRLRLPLGAGLNAQSVAVIGIALIWSQTVLLAYLGEFPDRERRLAKSAHANTYQGLVWSGRIEWDEDEELPSMLDWVRTQTAPDDILAHTDPTPYTLFTERPSTSLPRRLEPGLLRGFLTRYRVAYLLLSAHDPASRYYRDELEALVTGGVSFSTVASYRVFDTRSLWR